MKTENLQEKIKLEKPQSPLKPAGTKYFELPDDNFIDHFGPTPPSLLPTGRKYFKMPDDYFFDCFAPPGGLKLEDIREMYRYREVKKEKYLSGTLQKVFSAIKTYFQKHKI